MNIAFIIGALCAAFLLMFIQYLVYTSHRLDRLHIRYDASWNALAAALDRRNMVARYVGLTLNDHELVHSAAQAEQANHRDRYRLENELNNQLSNVDYSALPPALIAELADAHARVKIARRFHDDAVFDTRALRSTVIVRLFRLAGKVPLPEYFNVVELGPQTQ